MVTGDGAYIKKINRGLILQNIIEHGMISRADISKITGLNKATVSVQVADLLEEELIYELDQEHHAVGRKPIMLSINGKAGYVLGIDLDYEHIKFMVSDLHGNTVINETFMLETSDYHEIVQILIRHINKYRETYKQSHYGLISVLIGIHGTVNKDETIYFVPKFRWQHKDLKTDLSKELDIEIHIENNANLSAYAERVYKHHRSDNLLTILLSSGIGAGIMIDGKLHKGYHGYAGEMGHMIIVPEGKPCKCGNHGCWERYAAEPGIFEELSKSLERPSISYEDIGKLLIEQEPATCKIIKDFISYLTIGLNNIINLYNPETIVLNSEILRMHPDAIEEIKSNLKSSVSQYGKIVLSELGSKADVMGATALAIQQFLEVPELILNTSDSSIYEESVIENN
jgi:predicted NBD/HSP70 family sugar kinase